MYVLSSSVAATAASAYLRKTHHNMLSMGLVLAALPEEHRIAGLLIVLRLMVENCAELKRERYIYLSLMIHRRSIQLVLLTYRCSQHIYMCIYMKKSKVPQHAMEGWADFLGEMGSYYGVDMDCLSHNYHEEQKEYYMQARPLFSYTLTWDQST